MMIFPKSFPQKSNTILQAAGIEAKEFSDKKREKLAKEDKAEPDGSYPIENKSDLKRAKQALGRSKNKAKTKKWINKRAKELGAPKLGETKE
jgi:hypothetical protein